MATTFGQKLAALSALDTTVTVTAGTSANGASKDIGVDTSPQAVMVVCEFALTQTGVTDAGDVEVKVQHSDDNTTWPDDDQGTPVFSWKAAAAGNDLTRSEVVSFHPKLRYFRFRYKNSNGTDAFDMASNVALQLMQDDAA